MTDLPRYKRVLTGKPTLDQNGRRVTPQHCKLLKPGMTQLGPLIEQELLKGNVPGPIAIHLAPMIADARYNPTDAFTPANLVGFVSRLWRDAKRFGCTVPVTDGLLACRNIKDIAGQSAKQQAVEPEKETA